MNKPTSIAFGLVGTPCFLASALRPELARDAVRYARWQPGPLICVGTPGQLRKITATARAELRQIRGLPQRGQGRAPMTGSRHATTMRP